MEVTSDRIDQVVEDKSDSSAIAEQLRMQGEAIAELRSEIQQALAAGVTEAIKLVEDGDRVEEEEYDPIRTTIGEPDERQLKKIIELTGVASEASEWLVAGIHASNNLLDRSSRRWSIEAIQGMGIDFIGKPFITDHSWAEVDTAKGICISSALLKDHASIVPSEMLSGAGEEVFNKEIIEKEGLVWLYLCVAVPRSSEAAKAIETRTYHSVSTGSILFDAYLRCPNCERESGGREVRMDTYTIDPKTQHKVFDCPHLVGGSVMKQILGDEYENYNFSDYSILSCRSTSSVEISACQAGALPQASIIRE